MELLNLFNGLRPRNSSSHGVLNKGAEPKCKMPSLHFPAQMLPETQSSSSCLSFCSRFLHLLVLVLLHMEGSTFIMSSMPHDEENHGVAAEISVAK